MHEEVVEGCGDEEVEEGQGGHSVLLNSGGGEDEEAVDEGGPGPADSVEVEFEDLFYSFEGKDFLGFFGVLVLQALVGDFY